MRLIGTLIGYILGLAFGIGWIALTIYVIVTFGTFGAIVMFVLSFLIYRRMDRKERMARKAQKQQMLNRAYDLEDEMKYQFGARRRDTQREIDRLRTKKISSEYAVCFFDMRLYLLQMYSGLVASAFKGYHSFLEENAG